MKEVGMLNAEISYAISRLGHMDEIIICDAGFPIPLGVKTIDISLAPNKPTLVEVLSELLKYFSVERAILADETRKLNPTRFNDIIGLFDKSVEVETISHAELKQRSRSVKAVVRTGDFTAYSNVLLVSGAGSRWYVEER
ncbi:MAG TPA: D-ribose pyranase [Firmicutes bacterium]|nr:D-ribose pyranase [Bacillota bacterium]